jgi:hypothetical protein
MYCGAKICDNFNKKQWEKSYDVQIIKPFQGQTVTLERWRTKRSYLMGKMENLCARL